MAPQANELNNRNACRRLRVVTTERLQIASSRVLQLRTEALDNQKPSECVINLSGLWTNTVVKPNTIIHLIGAEYDQITSVFNVTNGSGLMVIDPDELMPCTFVVSSLYCGRKTWLGNMFNGWTSTNQAMTIGNMVHELFQYACERKITDEKKLYEVLLTNVNNFITIQQCYSIELDLDTLLKLSKEYIPNISGWLKKYLLIGPLHPLSNDNNRQVKVEKILDIEETIWATKYGLKGKIDLTGVVKIHDQKSRNTQTKILPLELKTGSQYFASSHVGQVSLYSFMIEDRHGVTDQGLLVYLKDGPALHGIDVNQNHKRDLMILRNKLTEHHSDLTLGPDFKEALRDCSRCERLLECVLMSQTFQPEALKSSSVMKSLASVAIGHLNEAHLRFFKYWFQILSEDSNRSHKRVKNSNTFWTYDSSQAESQGSGLSKLSIKSEEIKNDDDIDEGLGTSQDGFVIFERHRRYKDSLGPLKAENLARKRVAISVDDDINRDLTSQNINVAKTTGVIIYSDETSVKLSVDNALPRNDPDIVYRIDFVESARKDNQRLTNILRLMYPIDWRYDHLRQILIPDDDGKKDLKLAINLGGQLVRSTNHITSQLDFEQKKFIIRAAISDDYYVLNEKVLSDEIKISPALTAFVKVVLHLNRTVLMVASEFSSMSSIIKIMATEKIDFSTLGYNHSDLKQYELSQQIGIDDDHDVASEKHELIKAKYAKGFDKFDSCKILVTTYYNVARAPLLERRTFDYCLMMDCDKTELPACLEPMFLCDRYVIVDYQPLKGPRGDEQTNTISSDCKKKKSVPSLGNYLRQLTNST